MGIKKVVPAPEDCACKQCSHVEESYNAAPKQPTSPIFTTADNHLIRFTYHNDVWQAEVEAYSSNDSSQCKQLPVVFEPDFTLEHLVNSNPTEQKHLLHICPSQEEPEQPGYVYVGRAPIQEESHPKPLSSPVARQTAPPSEVVPVKPQATTQQQQ